MRTDALACGVHEYAQVCNMFVPVCILVCRRRQEVALWRGEAPGCAASQFHRPPVGGLPLTSYTSRNSWAGRLLPEMVHFCFLVGLSLLMQVAITHLELFGE